MAYAIATVFALALLSAMNGSPVTIRRGPPCLPEIYDLTAGELPTD